MRPTSAAGSHQVLEGSGTLEALIEDADSPQDLDVADLDAPGAGNLLAGLRSSCDESSPSLGVPGPVSQSPDFVPASAPACAPSAGMVVGGSKVRELAGRWSGTLSPDENSLTN